MSEQKLEHIDDACDELRETIETALAVGRYLVELKKRGVMYVDENMEPATPDNVVLFPTHRRVQ